MFPPYYLWWVMILRFLFYAFLIYLAYKLVFDFIIPVYRTTRKIKKGFREMQEQMNAGMQGRQPGEPVQGKTVQQKPSAATQGDYIDFEEVKEEGK